MPKEFTQLTWNAALADELWGKYTQTAEIISAHRVASGNNRRNEQETDVQKRVNSCNAWAY